MESAYENGKRRLIEELKAIDRRLEEDPDSPDFTHWLRRRNLLPEKKPSLAWLDRLVEKRLGAMREPSSENTGGGTENPSLLYNWPAVVYQLRSAAAGETGIQNGIQFLDLEAAPSGVPPERNWTARINLRPIKGTTERLEVAVLVLGAETKEGITPTGTLHLLGQEISITKGKGIIEVRDAIGKEIAFVFEDKKRVEGVESL